MAGGDEIVVTHHTHPIVGQVVTASVKIAINRLASSFGSS
jgi:hypothetical protein